MKGLEQVKLTREDLIEIFGDKEKAIREIEKVFSEHESIETVILDPNSWVGKELLWQSMKMIELQRGMMDLAAKLNQITEQLHKTE